MLNRDEMVEAMRAEGFTHVKTRGGVVPLEQWFPYGREEAEEWRGEVVSPGWAEDNRLGRWEFLKIEGVTWIDLPI